MERWSFRIVDVFTQRPLEGNQLAVFEDATDIPESLLQPLAQEIGYSETVFTYPRTEDADARIRIFTPTSEVPFAGHPVLGTAVVVATHLGTDHVVLRTGRGPVPVRVDRKTAPATRGAQAGSRYRSRSPQTTSAGASSAARSIVGGGPDR